MNSFAFWCRPNEGGGKDRVDGQGIEAMVNINLWIADSLEHGKSSTTAFDFGLMLSPACSDGQDDGKAGDTAQGDEKSEDLKGDVSILDSIKGISLYCPFKIDKSCFSDLMPKLNKETLGAIFNDRCRVSEVDFTSRYVEVNLANDESRGPFLLLSCDVLKFEECDGGAATVINIDFPHIAREVGGESRRVYVRFRLYIDQNSGLAKRNDSRDRLFTSAFSREEAIDLRINDYRTLSDEMREKVDGVDPDAYPLKSVTVHTLLMARTSVAVESFEDLHEKRLLEGDSVWGGYLPEGLSASDVVAWHWKKKINRPGDGYKMYLKLSYSVCNWGTIALYLLFLTAFSVFTNVLATVLCDLTWLGAIGASGASLAACAVLLVVFGVFRVVVQSSETAWPTFSALTQWYSISEERGGVVMERLKIVSVENKTEVGRLHAICRGSFKRYYPGFDGWYRAKVLPGIGSSRWVLKAISGDRMAGICIVKDDGAEKKICSLRVDANHRGRGVGTALIAASIELLDDERPLITVPQEVMPSLSPLLEKFGFEAMAEYRNLYREGASEFFYNGTLASSTGIAETFDVRSSLDLVFR